MLASKLALQMQTKQIKQTAKAQTNKQTTEQEHGKNLMQQERSKREAGPSPGTDWAAALLCLFSLGNYVRRGNKCGVILQPGSEAWLPLLFLQASID